MTSPRSGPDRSLDHQSASPIALPEEEAEGNLGETLARVRRTVTKYRWWILLPACAVTLATVGVLRRLPNRYTSEATLVVVQQRVPERYVVPNSTTPVAAELQAMQQEALSRTRLQEIIRQFGLYSKEATRLAPEEVIELMQKDIDITPLAETKTSAGRDFNAFKISFTAEAPIVAQQVTSTLTSLIIQENLKTRSEQATNTTSFLHEQLEAAQKNLANQEQRLRDFKMQYLGELPEQQSGNLAILTSLQTQLQNTEAAMSRAQEHRAYLESLLSGYKALSARNVPLAGSSDVNVTFSPIEAAQNDLAKLQAERATLLSRYRPSHPDVRAKEQEIASATATLDHLQAQTPKTTPPSGGKTENPPSLPVEAGDQPAIAQTKSQLEANRLEMDNLAKEQTQLKTSLVQYQNRLNLTPVREQQLTGLLRDYDLQKQNYADLVNKELQSQLATNLEKDQGGRQFRLVDPPSLPTVPSSPQRLKINLGGAAGGVLLGLALAFWMAMRDRSFYAEKQLSQRFGLPLVVGVPMLLTPSQKRSRVWRASLEWLAGSFVVVVVCAVEYYTYNRG
jgi:polysaccharide chain length determinant protein (PEP-CTERM system associated)